MATFALYNYEFEISLPDDTTPDLFGNVSPITTAKANFDRRQKVFDELLGNDHDGSKPITYLSKNGKQTYKHKWLMKPQDGIYYFRLLHEHKRKLHDEDLREFLNRLKFNHIANADTASGGKVTPYTQDIPYQARQAFLTDLRARMYEDFGGLDVHTIAAGSTNDHIDAAYQPLDENAADFEHWVADAIINLLALQGIDDTPQFRRARISNQKEQVDMLVQEAAWLDQNTIIRKLPNLSPEEAQAAIIGNTEEDMARMGLGNQRPQEVE